jgi:hypothetical protein
MAAVLQAIALVSEPPGVYLYQVVLLCILALIAARTAAVGAKGLALAFVGLAGVRLAALLISLLTSGLPLYQLIIIPPLDRAVACLTIFGLIWAFTYPPKTMLAYGLAAAALILTGAAAVASWVIWVNAVGAGSLFYNGSILDTVWLTAQLFLLAAGMFVLFRQRRARWQAGLVLLAVLFAGEALHYLYPIADASVAGFVRYAELIVWPAAALVLWGRPLSVPAEETVPAAGAASPPPANDNLSLELLRTELEAANRRNQQLRETNRQTRQQLAAATAALAKAAQDREVSERAAAAGPAGPQEAAPARAELAQEQAARAQAEAAVQALEQRVVSLEAMLQAARDHSGAAIRAAEELQAVRRKAQSQSQLVAKLSQQVAELQAQQQQEAAARQAAETQLAKALEFGQMLTAQVAESIKAEAGLRSELRDSQAALVESRRTGDRAQEQFAEQAAQLGALQQQVVQLERAARERNGQVERRQSASQAGAVDDKRGSSAARPPKNGSSHEEAATVAGGNGNGATGRSSAPARPAKLASDKDPELPPTIAGPVCQYLGLHSDHATRHAFPSDANRCLRLSAPAEVTFEQQRHYCLGSAHATCPVFTRQLLHPTVPIDTTPVPPPEPKSNNGLGSRVGRLFRRQP